jgi:hypothetical protein
MKYESEPHVVSVAQLKVVPPRARAVEVEKEIGFTFVKERPDPYAIKVLIGHFRPPLLLSQLRHTASHPP